MNDPLRDPAENYSVPQFQPSGMRIPEFVFRQLIGWALAQIRDSIDKPKSVVDQLFASAPDEFRTQVKAWIREHKNIYLDVSWPREDAHLPMIVCEPQAEQENTGAALLGDLGGLTERGTFGDVEPSDSLHYVIPEKRSTMIYIGASDDRLTLALFVLVKFILASNKQALTEWYDVHNMTLSGQVLQHDDRQFPTFGFYRVLQVSFDTMFDFNGVEEAAKVVRVDLAVDFEGEPVVVTTVSSGS